MPANAPAPFIALAEGRQKRTLGDLFGLTGFGVNLVRLAPGGRSALRHAHSHEDEFVYVIEGEAVLITDRGETALRAGMCAGFKAGSGDAHQLVNRGSADVLYLEAGARIAGDTVVYPDDDIAAVQGADHKRIFTHKDGTPY
ncbi:MAG: cupin domain-containing protein [Pseudomonadota bacterium]